jgi:hypothetical protein
MIQLDETGVHALIRYLRYLTRDYGYAPSGDPIFPRLSPGRPRGLSARRCSATGGGRGQKKGPPTGRAEATGALR